MEALRQAFRPEFINRIDDIVLFNPLGQEQLNKIIDLELAKVMRLLAERKVRIELTPAARERLVRDGYDPAYGARPLRRTVQTAGAGSAGDAHSRRQRSAGQCGARRYRSEFGRHAIRTDRAESEKPAAGQARSRGTRRVGGEIRPAALRYHVAKPGAPGWRIR